MSTENNATKIDIDELKEGEIIVAIDLELKKEIKAYLETRPYIETNQILEAVFADENIGLMLTHLGFTTIVEYLTKCPQKEVKDIIKKLSTDQYVKMMSRNANKE